MKKILLTAVATVLLVLSAGVNAEPVTIVFNCELNDGKTKEDALAINAKWLKWARATGGSDEITSAYVATLIGDMTGHLWVDTYPDLVTWAKVFDAEAESEISAAFDALEECTRTSMLRGEQTVPAK
jgi:hypothetical protein